MEIDLREIETPKEGSPLVVSRVLHLLKDNPDKFKSFQCLDCGTPYNDWSSGVEIENKDRLKISITRYLQGDHIEIRIHDFDSDKPSWEDKYSYRVDVFGGSSARAYRYTPGFVTSKPSFVFDGVGGQVIISDNWAETVSTSEATLSLLKNVTFFDQREKPKYLENLLKTLLGKNLA